MRSSHIQLSQFWCMKLALKDLEHLDYAEDPNHITDRDKAADQNRPISRRTLYKLSIVCVPSHCIDSGIMQYVQSPINGRHPLDSHHRLGVVNKSETIKHIPGRHASATV
jgi:hypothetical protein